MELTAGHGRAAVRRRDGGSHVAGREVGLQGTFLFQRVVWGKGASLSCAHQGRFCVMDVFGVTKERAVSGRVSRRVSDLGEKACSWI